MFMGDFTKQPLRVTINNIWKEFSNPTEIMWTSFIKAYSISLSIHNIGPTLTHLLPSLDINAKSLNDDSTHVGNGFSNMVSAIKNQGLYLMEAKQGSIEYESYRPYADGYKGSCKMLGIYVLGAEHAFKINLICEYPSRYYLDGRRKVEKSGFDATSDIQPWIDQTMNSEFLLLTARKAGMTILSSKLAQLAISTVKPIVIEYSKEILSEATIDFCSSYTAIPVLGMSLAILPSISGFLEGVSHGMFFAAPINRALTYQVNKKLVTLFEHNGEFICAEIGKAFTLAEQENITIEYQYDSYKVLNKDMLDHKLFDEQMHYICDLGEETSVLAKQERIDSENHIIIHYPQSEDVVGYVGDILLSPITYLMDIVSG